MGFPEFGVCMLHPVLSYLNSGKTHNAMNNKETQGNEDLLTIKLGFRIHNQRL